MIVKSSFNLRLKLYLAVLQRHVELLVGDEELRANVLAGVDDLLGVLTDASGHEPVLIGELEDALDGRSAVDGSVALGEHGHHLLVLGDGLTHVLQRSLPAGQLDTAALFLLDDVDSPHEEVDAVVTAGVVIPPLGEYELVLSSVVLPEYITRYEL